jgi:alpha-tubulin suppressor-like RCC1 family protein
MTRMARICALATATLPVACSAALTPVPARPKAAPATVAIASPEATPARSDARRVIDLRAGAHATCATFASGEVVRWGFSGQGADAGPAILGDIHDAVSALPSGNATLVLHRGGALERIEHGAARARRKLATAVSAFSDTYVIREGRVERYGVRDAEAPSPVFGYSIVAGVVERIGPATDLLETTDYACALAKSGAAVCWGKTPFAAGKTDVPIEVPASGIAQLAGEGSTLCARMASGATQCWEGGKPRVIEHEPAAEIAVGLLFSCVRTPDGRVQCREHGSLSPWLSPDLAAASDDPVERITVDFQHLCLLRRSGKLECAGANGDGELGDGAALVHTRPHAVTGVLAARISAGSYGSCAFDEARRATCWGTRFGDRPRSVPELDGSLLATSASFLWSQRGAEMWATDNLRRSASFTPVSYDAKLPLRSLAVSSVWGDLCSVDADGHAWCTKEVSASKYLEIGAWRIPGERLQALDRATSLDAGTHTICGVTQGKITCVKRVEERFVVRPIAGLQARTVAVGAYFACATTEQREVACFDVSQIRSIGAATPIMGLAAVDQLMMGDHFGCARSAGVVHCWSTDEDGGTWGELGQGDRARVAPFTPKPVSLPGKALDLSAGPRHACAVVEDGQVLCWGDDRNAQTSGVRRVSSSVLVEVAKPK